MCKRSYTYQNGDICYGFVSEKKSWGDAQAHCISIGGYLAEIKTEEQNIFVEHILFEHQNATEIWLGATDLVSEGSWYWATSDVPVTAGFTFWLPGEPNNKHGADCMEFEQYGYRNWNDEKCENKKSFVCQKSDSIVIG